MANGESCRENGVNNKFLIIFFGKMILPGKKKCPVGTPAAAVKTQYFPDSTNQLSFPSTVLHRRNFY